MTNINFNEREVNYEIYSDSTGELRNKGAQAMTSKVLDEIKKYRQKNCIITSVFDDTEKEKASQLNFSMAIKNQNEINKESLCFGYRDKKL